MRSSNTASTLIALAVCSVAASVVVAGCKAPDTSSNTPAPTTSSGPILNTAKFAVGTGFPSNVTVVTHTYTDGSGVPYPDWNTRCEIDPAETSQNKKDIICYVEVAELDLYFNPFSIQANAPTGMCAYVEFQPYWFYQYKAGNGATNFSYKVDNSGHINSLVDATGTVTVVNNAIHCLYDYSTFGGPNCCSGGWTAAVQTQDSTGAYTASTASGAWGGQYGNCAAGVGAQSDFKRSRVQNLPGAQLYYSPNTITAGVTVQAPIGTYGTNLWSANWVDTANDPTPPAVSDIYAQPYYQWKCLDSAMEVQSRIRVAIRTWKMNSQLALGVSGNPNTSCVTEPNFPGEPCNDYKSWHDFATYPNSGL